MSEMRIGQGVDVHQLVEGRRFVLGGIEIDHSHGLLGHSDADVLLHAITDALLGAVGQGDIGQWFPDTDSEWRDADSALLLKKVWEKLSDDGWRLANMDSTVVAERPKLSPYIGKMKERIAEILNADVATCSVKATTSEAMGFVGREEGVLATCVVLLYRDG